MNIGAIGIEQIVVNDNNIRSMMNDETIAELAESIQSVGLLSPLVVTPRDGQFMLIAGHRRYAALRQLGWTDVVCSVVESDEPEHETLSMLVENTQREDISPIDEARAYAKLQAAGMTQTVIAERVGKSVAHVSKRIKLTGLPVELQTAIGESRMTIQHALELADIPHGFLKRFIDDAVKGKVLLYNKWDVERARREARDADNIQRIQQWTEGIKVVSSVTPEMNLEYVKRLDADGIDTHMPENNEVIKWDGKSSWLQVYRPLVEKSEDDLDEFDLYDRECERIDAAYTAEFAAYRDAMNAVLVKTVHPGWREFDSHYTNGLFALIADDWQLERTIEGLYGKDFPEETDDESGFERWLRLSDTNMKIAVVHKGILESVSREEIGRQAGLVVPVRGDYPPEPVDSDSDQDDDVYADMEWEDDQYDIGMEE